MRVSTVLLFLTCILAWAMAAPVSDTEAALRISPMDGDYRSLNKYLQRYGSSDDLQDMYFSGEHGSKRGLGPRPLRFG